MSANTRSYATRIAAACGRRSLARVFVPGIADARWRNRRASTQLSRIAAARWRKRLACIVLTAPLVAIGAVGVEPPPPPPALSAPAMSLVAGARVVGAATFTYFGLPIYDAYYYSTGGDYTVDKPFALALHYRRNLHGRAIASRSSEEIAQLGIGTRAEREQWDAAMKATFPDVHPGDDLTGINVPGEATRFFRNGRPIGEIADPAFGAAFFAIWFDPRTSQPELRRRLLGERAQPRSPPASERTQ